MHLRAPELEIPEDNPFLNDALGRTEGVNALADFLNSVDEPLVIALDSPWGSGKTTFLRMTNAVLRKRGFHTLYFNAWLNDFTDDPFVALMAEVRELQAQASSSAKSKAQQRLKKLQQLGVALGKQALPQIIKAATAGAVDLNQITEDAISSIAEKLTTEALANYDKAKDTLERFRTELEKYVEVVQSGEELTHPVVFFVDELDRCRPTYSISLLEKIKHLFAVKGLIFVLAADLRQLAHSLRAVYGLQTDTEGYLSRFMDIDYRLPQPEKGKYCSALFAKYALDDYFSSRRTSNTVDDKDVIHTYLTELFWIFDFSLRQQDKCFTRLSVVCRLTKSDFLLYPVVLCVFMVLRMARPELFNRYVSGDASPEAILTEVRKLPKATVFLADYQGIWFEAALIAGLPDDRQFDAIVKDYKTKVESAQADDPKARHNYAVLQKIHSLRSSHGSPMSYLLKKIEIAQTFS